jgi:hypothetical protein
LQELDLIVHTPHGPLHFTSQAEGEGSRLTLDIPSQVEAELVIPESFAASISLPAGSTAMEPGLRCFELKSGTTNEVWLRQR